MDAAWWPFLSRRIRKTEPEVWWEKGEDPEQLRLEALGLTESDGPPEPLRHAYEDYFPQRKGMSIGEIRAEYEPLLEKEPFWRPLVAVTLATRPLANTLVRLCRSLPRGLAFYASIDTHDRKTVLSFPDRMRLLRLRRMRELTIEIARRLEGYYGGFIGIRFNQNDKGRAIRGERLEQPLPDSLRVVKVGLENGQEIEKDAEYQDHEKQTFDSQDKDDALKDEEDGDKVTDDRKQRTMRVGSAVKSEKDATIGMEKKIASAVV
ncbi:hypothetical protein RHS01_07320 [Rhizoctonia solani]|uniref:Uncharacterized protein n=1 Tax=Rhizoctonia solani TaxID=456999 RepID=A0A8H7I9L0_9AGAM|nr:hypothetical protein RHS01_07320 [Rhizoctonia solani]